MGWGIWIGAHLKFVITTVYFRFFVFLVVYFSVCLGVVIKHATVSGY